MANYCRQCSVRIPEGQEICSICYGDPDYGSDGYLRALMEEELESKEYKRWLEEEGRQGGRI